jgi:hypothetical protein
VAANPLVVHDLRYLQGSLQAAQRQIAMPGAWQAEDEDGRQTFIVHGDLTSDEKINTMHNSKPSATPISRQQRQRWTEGDADIVVDLHLPSSPSVCALGGVDSSAENALQLLKVSRVRQFVFLSANDTSTRTGIKSIAITNSTASRLWALSRNLPRDYYGRQVCAKI